MDDGHFSLSHDKFEATAAFTLKELLNDEQFTDVTLACADYVRKMVHLHLDSLREDIFRYACENKMAASPCCTSGAKLVAQISTLNALD